ncbi:3-mercaptopyruvate sulfurtransferase, partial [Globisporangium splendens]
MFVVLRQASRKATAAASPRTLWGTMVQPFSTRLVSPLVTTDQVQSLVDANPGSVRFLDASWYLDKSRNGKQEFAQERIPGAAFFDIEEISDKTSSLPHMLPPTETFERAMTHLGVSNDDTVIVYVGKNCFSAARCWWTFKYFGHENVHIMNGGLAKWKSEDREVSTDSAESSGSISSGYKAHPKPELVVSWEDVFAKLHGETQIVDARGAGRFHAKDPEPRAGMRGGHIPGAVNVPFGKLVAPDDYSVRSKKWLLSELW